MTDHPPLRCWQKASGATCSHCRTTSPLRRMLSAYAWECPECGRVYPCHPTDVDKVELNPRPQDFTQDTRWRMDAITGIPYPTIHDLQEPVTRGERILFAIFRCLACGAELRQPRSRALDHDDLQWALKIIVEIVASCKRLAMSHECKAGQVGAMEFVMAIVDDGTPEEVTELERFERYQGERRCR